MAVFGVDKETVSETQWCSLEGYINSDTLFIIEHIETGKICGTFVLARRTSTLSSMSTSLMEKIAR